MLTKLKVVSVTGFLVIAAVSFNMPTPPVAACDEWPGGGLDDAPYQTLFSINAPLHGRDNINRAAARALDEAWAAAGRPDNFDATPYLKYGPDCDGPTSASLASTNSNNDNKQDNENK